MDFKTFIQAIFAEDTNMQYMDVSEGSNLYDLLVVPMAAVLETKMENGLMEDASDKLDLSQYATMSYDDLVKFARNHFLELPDSNETRGEVFFHLLDAVEIEFDAGTVLYANKKIFFTMHDISLNASDYTIVDGLYKTPAIKVRNILGQSVTVNEISSIEGAPEELIKITHLAMDSGVLAKTNREVYSKIMGTLSSGQYISAPAIQRAIDRICGSAVRVEVIGQGDSYMTRDLAYNMSSPNDSIEKESGFYGKIREKADEWVYNTNKAFKAFTSTTGTQLSLTEESGVEFLQDEYILIANQDASNIAISTKSVLAEGFISSSEVTGALTTITEDALATATTLEVTSTTGLEAEQIIKIVTYNASGVKEGVSIGVIKSIDTATKILTLYTAIGKAVDKTSTPAPYVEVVSAMGYQLGNGWVRGETGMTLGSTLTEQEVMIVDNKLVLGLPNTSFGGNVVMETITKMGIDNFLEAIRRGVIIQKTAPSSAKQKVYREIIVDQGGTTARVTNNTGGQSAQN